MGYLTFSFGRKELRTASPILWLDKR